mmetsp:Transcript_104338/g.238950  ORF Transcript_104338/g.238950 Transcript_104338/m.238950 type:complete len:138 (+) Transcript_104338:476-889(+)
MPELGAPEFNPMLDYAMAMANPYPACRRNCTEHDKPVCNFKERELTSKGRRKCECRVKDLPSYYTHCHNDACVREYADNKQKHQKSSKEAKAYQARQNKQMATQEEALRQASVLMWDPRYTGYAWQDRVDWQGPTWL